MLSFSDWCETRGGCGQITVTHPRYVVNCANPTPQPRRADDVRLKAYGAASLECLGLGLYSKRNRAMLTCKYLLRNEVLQWATSIIIEEER